MNTILAAEHLNSLDERQKRFSLPLKLGKEPLCGPFGEKFASSFCYIDELDVLFFVQRDCQLGQPLCKCFAGMHLMEIQVRTSQQLSIFAFRDTVTFPGLGFIRKDDDVFMGVFATARWTFVITSDVGNALPLGTK